MATGSGAAGRNQLDFKLILEPVDDRDTDHLDRLGHQLRTELRQTDIGSISAMGSAEIPADERGAEVASPTGWLIPLSVGGGALKMLVQTLRD